MAAYPIGRMRASDAERDEVAAVLATGYAQGRLTKAELDERIDQLHSAQTYAQLAALTADLPGAMPVSPQPPVAAAAAGTNGLAVASLVCGLCQFLFPPVLTVLAIVFGHTARGQIRRTGQSGKGMATCGLVLGWMPIIAGLLIVILVVAHN
jgi:Domain of unknown function (DUF1707)/Domain of unknown function (DUF4190)